MAVLYKFYQNKNEKSSAYNKWYARATQIDTVDLAQMAEIIQRNCTVKRSDVLAVLTELVEVMKDQLQASMRVKIDGFGAFKIGLRTQGADSIDDFTVAKNVKGLRLNFQPEVKIDRSTNSRTVAFLAGTTLKEAQEYSVEDASSDAEG